GVDEREGERGEQLALLAPLGRRAHDRRRVPLAVDHRIAFRAQPLGEQRELGALARAVDPLDDEQPPRVLDPPVAEHGRPGRRDRAVAGRRPDRSTRARNGRAGSGHRGRCGGDLGGAHGSTLLRPRQRSTRGGRNARSRPAPGSTAPMKSIQTAPAFLSGSVAETELNSNIPASLPRCGSWPTRTTVAPDSTSPSQRRASPYGAPGTSASRVSTLTPGPTAATSTSAVWRARSRELAAIRAGRPRSRFKPAAASAVRSRPRRVSGRLTSSAQRLASRCPAGPWRKRINRIVGGSPILL